MFLLSGLFAATNTTKSGRAGNAFPDFVFGGLGSGGVSLDSEKGGKLEM